MNTDTPSLESVNAYISSFPDDVRQKLEAIRAVIKSVVPDAQEKISYQMPGFTYKKRPLVYFAAFSSHIGLYPTPTGIEEFKEELSRYKQGKGSVQFPHSEELPLELIARITAYRAQENRQLEVAGKKKNESRKASDKKV